MKYNTDQKNMILYVKGDSVRNILDPRCELIIIQIIIAFSYRVQSVVDEKGLMLSLLILAVLYESHNGDGTFWFFFTSFLNDFIAHVRTTKDTTK